MPFDSDSGREAGKKSKKGADPRKKKFDLLLDEVGEKITAEDLWAEIKKIDNPEKKVSAMLKILEFRVAKPKQHEVKIDASESGYIIGGLIPPQYESNG